MEEQFKALQEEPSLLRTGSLDFVERILMTTTATAMEHDTPDVAPAYVPFMIAVVLSLIVVVMLGWGWMTTTNRNNDGSFVQAATEGDDFEVWTSQGNLSITILVLTCMIPSFLVLGGIQINFNTTMFVITIFPISLIIIGAIQTLSRFKALRKQYWRTKRMGNVHGLASVEACLRTFEVHSLFADPDEPLARVVLVGTSQIMLLGMYVWGLWDRGKPDFNEQPRLYAYYYAGMFLLVTYIAGKLSGDKESHLKRYAHEWRQSIQLGGAPAKRQLANRPSGLFSSPTYWAFFFLGVDLLEDDFRWASEGEITMATLLLRYALDTLVNTAGLFYIMIGLPIQVAHNIGPIEFVLTAVAAFYILEMDNSADVHTVVIPNFDHERRFVDTRMDDSEADVNARELLAILKGLPSEARKPLADLLTAPSTTTSPCSGAAD
ncbi:hypothetical protein MHU86_16613 [Fragilaria crotonensis]|nr:hypothetical protein MHU86_16613 [Fragilaria crotonensis]